MGATQYDCRSYRGNGVHSMSNKTHKGIHKRLKRTATGKVLRRRSGKRHLMSTKSARRARRLSGWRPVAKPDVKTTEKQYGKV